ncbi:MAG: hypothetical protein H7232_05420 [Aeromicrobium sp.]|nr:hypothetical protein [Burkholderiales bacterium]
MKRHMEQRMKQHMERQMEQHIACKGQLARGYFRQFGGVNGGSQAGVIAD